MDNSINDIIGDLAKKYNLTKSDIERVIDAQFKVLALQLNKKEVKDIYMIYLGKFKPTPFLVKQNKEKQNELVKEV